MLHFVLHRSPYYDVHVGLLGEQSPVFAVLVGHARLKLSFPLLTPLHGEQFGRLGYYRIRCRRRLLELLVQPPIDSCHLVSIVTNN